MANRGPLAAALFAVSLLPLGACAQPERTNPIVDVLRRGEVAFGSMVQDRSEAGAARMAADARLDFLFYDMERSYDFEGLQAFMRGLGSPRTQALLVRIAPVADGREDASTRVAELLAAGVDGIVFPHVRNVDDARFAVGLLQAGPRGVWPVDPDGTVVGYFMLEDREAVENARAILATPGVSFGAPGQGSLRSALGGDADAVAAAVVTILARCKELRVVCAKLADETDVEARIREGFRVILGSGAALDIGRRAAGRDPAR